MSDDKILIDIYKKAQMGIIRKVQEGLSANDDPKYFKTILNSIQKILKSLKAQSDKEVEKMLFEIYKTGMMKADEHLIKFDADNAKFAGSFGQIHTQAVKVLSNALEDRLDSQINVVWKRSKFMFDQMTLESIRGSVVGYSTWQESSKKLMTNLQKSGIQSFTDKLGRNWNLETYTNMCVRTATMESLNMGTANRLLEAGHDLVKVTSHKGACSRCQPWQGKILSLTGKTQGFPTLAQAKDAGLFHPNCRHSFGLYVDD